MAKKTFLKKGTYYFNKTETKGIPPKNIFAKEFLLSASIILGIFIEFYVFFDIFPDATIILFQSIFLSFNILICFLFINNIFYNYYQKNEEKKNKHYNLLLLALLLANLNHITTLIDTFTDITFTFHASTIYMFNIIFALFLISIFFTKFFITNFIRKRRDQPRVKPTYIFYTSALFTISFYGVSIVSMIFYAINVLYLFTFLFSIFILYFTLISSFFSKMTLKIENFNKKRSLFIFSAISLVFFFILILYLILIYVSTTLYCLEVYDIDMLYYSGQFKNLQKIWNLFTFYGTIISLLITSLFSFLVAKKKIFLMNWIEDINIVILK